MRKNVPGVAAGILAIACAAGLTAATVWMVLGELNRGADEAYAATYAELSRGPAGYDAVDMGVPGREPVVLEPGPTTVPEPTATTEPAATSEPAPGITVEDEKKPPSIADVDGKEGNNNVDIGVADAIDRFLENEFTTLEEDGTVVYHIQWGDTLGKISGMFGISVDELAEYNHIRDVNLIYATSSLRIPTGNWRKEA